MITGRKYEKWLMVPQSALNNFHKRTAQVTLQSLPKIKSRLMKFCSCENILLQKFVLFEAFAMYEILHLNKNTTACPNYQTSVAPSQSPFFFSNNEKFIHHLFSVIVRNSKMNLGIQHTLLHSQDRSPASALKYCASVLLQE